MHLHLVITSRFKSSKPHQSIFLTNCFFCQYFEPYFSSVFSLFYISNYHRFLKNKSSSVDFILIRMIVLKSKRNQFYVQSVWKKNQQTKNRNFDSPIPSFSLPNSLVPRKNSFSTLHTWKANRLLLYILQKGATRTSYNWILVRKNVVQLFNQSVKEKGN